MGVIQVKSEVFVRMHVNNNWSEVYNVKVKIFEIFESVSEVFNFFQEFRLFDKMNLSRFFSHVHNYFNL